MNRLNFSQSHPKATPKPPQTHVGALYPERINEASNKVRFVYSLKQKDCKHPESWRWS